MSLDIYRQYIGGLLHSLGSRSEDDFKRCSTLIGIHASRYEIQKLTFSPSPKLRGTLLPLAFGVEVSHHGIPSNWQTQISVFISAQVLKYFWIEQFMDDIKEVKRLLRLG